MASVQLSAKTMLLAGIRGQSSIVGLLASNDAERSVFPNSKADFGKTTPTPFLRIIENEMANTDDVVETSAFEIWIYDDPEEQYYRINRIVQAVDQYMVGLRLGETSQGVFDRFERDYVSGEAADDDTNKYLKIVRFRSWLVR